MIKKVLLLCLHRRLPKSGDYIKVISCPRHFDNADAYKGYTGIVTNHENKWLEIQNQNSVLIIPDTYIKKLKWIKICPVS